jgi:site-specific recombinase XerD
MTRVTAKSLTATASEAATSPTLAELLPRFKRHLAAENKAPRTIESYGEAVARLDEFLNAAGMPTRVAAITREHVEAFLQDQLARLRPSSARIRYASLRQFFAYVGDLGEITASPMANMKPPAVPETEVPIIDEASLRKLLKLLDGEGDFLGRRDAAIVRMFVDTGARLAEVAQLDVEHLNLEAGTVTFMGKGRRVRTNPIGSKTLRALDRYLVLRGRHPDRDSPALWLGTQGRLTSYGVAEAVKRRAAQAGVGDVHVHQLRHSTAHFLRLNGMDDDSVMRLMGWRDRSMLHRYGASAADERARDAFRRLSPGDRL